MPAWRKTRAAATVAVVCAAASVAAIVAGYLRVPLVRPPAPSGSWPVGTVTLDVRGDSPARDAAVQIWYPAARGTRGRAAPYLLNARRPLHVRLLNAIVATHAIVAAPAGNARFPVIVYVPGWGGKRENNTAVAQDLASNGYVVVAMDDPYPTPTMDFSSQDARRRTLVQANRKVRLEADDALRIVDALRGLEREPGGRFAGRLDLARIGVLGFSFGGAVAAEVARRDARVGAAVNLDGWLFGDALRAGVARPFLVVSAPLVSTRPLSQTFANDGARIRDAFDRENEQRQLAGLRRHGGYLVTVEGTQHYNFTDAAWLPSIRHTSLGSIDGRRGANIVAAYVRQFFDRSLKNDASPLFERREPVDGAARLLVFGSNGPA